MGNGFGISNARNLFRRSDDKKDEKKESGGIGAAITGLFKW